MTNATRGASGEIALSLPNRRQAGWLSGPGASATLGSGGYLASNSAGDRSSSIATLTAISLATGAAGMDCSCVAPLGAAGARVGAWA